MLEQLKYKNHLNEVFEFGKDGIFVNSNDLHDYEWAVTKKNDKIVSLSKGVVNRKLPVVIVCDTEENGVLARNKLMEIAEKDVLAMKYGQIILGGYYFKCYITKSVKKDYLLTKRHILVDLTLTTDFPYWVKESSYSFVAGSTESRVISTGYGLDYPFDYPHDYAVDLTNQTLTNTGFTAANFKIRIYGACVNPSITIGDHIYKVNCTVAAGEYLTIDSVEKKVYLTGSTGAVTNVFKYRERDHYVFEKIPSGNNVVAWSGDFGFDVILLEERSEPKWT